MAIHAGITGTKAVNNGKNTGGNSAPFFRPLVQPKLSINEPGDVYEQEADTVADKVMCMADAGASQPFFKPSSIAVQSKCSHCADEEVQSKEDTLNSPPAIQRDEANNTVVNPQNNAQPMGTEPQCKDFAPVAKVVKQNGSITTVIGLMDSKFDVFNGGGGDIDFSSCGMGNASNTSGVLTFKAAQGAAWQIMAKLQDCTDPDSTPDSGKPWRIGFIQTVESSTIGAQYANGNFTKITTSGRDALNKSNAQNKSVPAPWYDTPDDNFGSRLYPTAPVLNDTPHVPLPITHPNDSKSFIQSVCMKSKFNIWLIIHNKNIAPSATNVDFLHFWTINQNQNFFLNKMDGSVHPCNTGGWMKTGTITQGAMGAGKGSNTLIWDTPIANQAQVRDDTVKTNPCVSEEKK